MKTIKSSGTVKIEKDPKDFGHKMKLNRAVLKTRVKSNLMAIVQKDKQYVNILTNTCSPQLGDSFCNEHVKAVKPAIIQESNRHLRNVDKSYHMTNSYSITRQTWK